MGVVHDTKPEHQQESTTHERLNTIFKVMKILNRNVTRSDLCFIKTIWDMVLKMDCRGRDIGNFCRRPRVMKRDMFGRVGKERRGYIHLAGPQKT